MPIRILPPLFSAFLQPAESHPIDLIGGDSMEQIVNYIDIPESERDAVLCALFNLSFLSPASPEEVKAVMDQSRKGCLPQFLFVFRGKELFGHQFLIAEKENAYAAFPWWAVGDTDTLPLPLAFRVLDESIRLSYECGAPALAHSLELIRENYKKGIGRSPKPRA